jgi:hypothetical protein
LKTKSEMNFWKTEIKSDKWEYATRQMHKNDRKSRDGILNHGPNKGGHGTWKALREAPFLDVDPSTGEDDPNDPNYRSDDSDE